MKLEKSPMSFWKRANCKFLLMSLLLSGGSTLAEGFPDSTTVAQGVERRSVRSSLSEEAEIKRLSEAVKLSRQLLSGQAGATAQERIESAVRGSLGSLSSYPNLARVHGHEEPLWLQDRGEKSALAVIALCNLQKLKPIPDRAETIDKLARGLTYLQRKDRKEYPYGAHISWKDREPFTQLGDGSQLPTAFFRTDRAFAVEALALAGQVLQEKDYIESAQREALGMSTHLLVHGKLVSSFSPQPKYSKDVNDALPLVAGFVSLYEATGNRFYSDMGALASHWLQPSKSFSGPHWETLKQKLAASPSAELLRAESLPEPVTFQYVEAEDGKVVNKAIDTMTYQSSAGSSGKLAVMGRENTFWMRFDVPTEDDYLFDLSYLQSDVGGALVSVMMRIDGDKIFQVPLGDVDGKAIFRRKFVDGPRPLRSGPHSFGIRFSGLLMTKPALLDSVIVQPALERREFKLPNGQRLYLLRNATGVEAKTDVDHFASWPPLEAQVLTETGVAGKLGTSEDRRRRKRYVTVPPFGVALVKVKG